MKRLAISFALSVWNHCYTIPTDYGISRCILWEEIGLALWGFEFESKGNAICKIIWG